MENGSVVEKDVLTYYGQNLENSSKEAAIKSGLVIESVAGVLQSPTQFTSRAREFDVSNTADLLIKKDGKCAAWQDFFVCVLGAQGVIAKVLNIDVNNEIDAFKVKSGTPGQGTANPRESIWPNHAVVEYNGKVYDPSYGLEYAEGQRDGSVTVFQNFAKWSKRTWASIGIRFD